MVLLRYLMTVICIVFITTGAAAGEDVMKAVGDQVSFRPDKFIPLVTSIIWKHINTRGTVVKAIEWDEGEILIPNPRFKDITTVDEKTGQITITNLTVEHSGVYIIDINSKEQQQRFTLTVMERVPKPEIKTEKSEDNPDVVYLNCEYSETIIWKNSTGDILPGSKITPTGESITVKKTGNPETFYTCTLDNGASEETSDPVYERALFKDGSKSGSGWIVIIVVIIIIITVGVLLYYCNNFKNCVDDCDCCPCLIVDPEGQINNPSAQSRCDESVPLQTGNEGAENNDVNCALQYPADLSQTLFDSFVKAGDCKETQQKFIELCRHLKVNPGDNKHIYSKLKDKLLGQAKDLWQMIDKRGAHEDYKRSHLDYEQGKACDQNKCLVVGAGPCGLRTAIELALLGAQVVVLEKRDSFTRNNVLLLWPYTVKDLKNLGAEKLYGRFCKGSIKHISIRQLQLILLKLALILGVEVHTGLTFKSLVEPSESTGWRAEVSESDKDAAFQCDVFLSAGVDGGKRCLLSPTQLQFLSLMFFFLAGGAKCLHKEFQRIVEDKDTGRELAIGITANFVNFKTEQEAGVPEVGDTRSDNPDYFEQCKSEEDIDLENILYLKDETHYFVMTAEKASLINRVKKESLISRKVIDKDLSEVKKLLESKNINKKALWEYVYDAANFFTKEKLLEMEFVMTHMVPDVSIFNYARPQKAVNASMVKERKGKKLLFGLVGDSLVEPYWPEGTGIGRGFLGVFDAAWMVRSWGKGLSPLKVLAERESVYRHFSEMTEENISENHDAYSIDPSTRYPGVNTSSVQPSEVEHLYEVEEPRIIIFSLFNET